MFPDLILLSTVAYGSVSSFLIQLCVNALALLIAAFLLDGIQIKGIGSAFIIALVLAFLNATIGNFLTSITGFYRGLLHLVIDALVILIATKLLDGFKVKGFIWAFILALALTLLNGLLYGVLF